MSIAVTDPSLGALAKPLPDRTGGAKCQDTLALLRESLLHLPEHFNKEKSEGAYSSHCSPTLYSLLTLKAILLHDDFKSWTLLNQVICARMLHLLLL